MKSMYTAWNRRMRVVLSGLLVVCLLASLPLMLERMKTENTSKKVQFVFDYQDLLKIAADKPNPTQFIDQELKQIKEAGVGSLAVYESTLAELELGMQVHVYDSHDAALLDPSILGQEHQYTYVLFNTKAAQQTLEPLIRSAFARQHVQVDAWSLPKRSGLIVKMPMKEAVLKPMEPDPLTIQKLQADGFNIVARLSNKMQPYNEKYESAVLSKLHQEGVRWIVFDGLEVTGYADTSKQSGIQRMAQLMNAYHLGAATVEFTKQKGLTTLAKLTHYDMIRLHSLSAKESTRYAVRMTKSKRADAVRMLNDRFVLAVKERNIRMIYLNAKARVNPDTGTVDNPIHVILDSLRGPHGAIQRIEHAGYTIGTASPFYVHSRLQHDLVPFAYIGAVALIALMLSYFFPDALLALFVLGLIATALLYKVSPSLLMKAMALMAGISAPTLGCMLAVRSLIRKHDSPMSGLQKAGYVTLIFFRNAAVSLSAVFLFVGMMNNVRFFLLLDQFRGVSLLHIAPIVLITVYLLFYRERLSRLQKWEKARKLLRANITVIWVVIAAAIGGIGLYYLSRTGNGGHVSSIERMFRTMLEDKLGVRPRTKEFLIGHPLFIFGAYLSLRYRKALYFLIVGVIGQLSMDDTFAHLHTPVYISAIRVVYGMGFGLVIGLIGIAVWEVLVRGWNRWIRTSNES